MKKIVLIIISSLILSACSWVKLTAEGEKVRVLSATEVTSCKKLGKTRAMLKDKIAGISRSKEKVKNELETLARNSAASMGGDTIVAESAIENGEQEFSVLRCVQN